MKPTIAFVIAITCGALNYLSAVEPIAIAHRGLLRHAPENTHAAFAACLELRMGFELDIRTTSDGHLVVIHDDNLVRTTNGPSKSIRNITLAEAKELDAGSWFDAAYANERIPTFEETCELIKNRKQGPTVIALNIKDINLDGERKIIELLDKYGMFEYSFAFDQSEEVSKRLKALDQRLRIGQNVNRGSIKQVLEKNFIDVFLLSDTPTKAEVETLHASGKQVLFNYAGSGAQRRNTQAWRQAYDAGIDGMLTDYPTMALEVWREVRKSDD